MLHQAQIQETWEAKKWQAKLTVETQDMWILSISRLAEMAHLYNEEARAALLQRSGGEKAEELLQQAQHWMAGGA